MVSELVYLDRVQGLRVDRILVVPLVLLVAPVVEVQQLLVKLNGHNGINTLMRIRSDPDSFGSMDPDPEV